MNRARIGFALAVLAALALSCSQYGTESTEVRQLTPEETAELFDSAASVEAVGEPSIQAVTDDTGTTVITTQAFRLRTDTGRGGGTVLTGCTGRCKVTGPGGLSDCKTSGCLSDKKGGCTPLKCSGSCTVSAECSSLNNVGLFAQ
jgi:hypothetical protein